jgi:benzylsuccinate CoA-transferase BbsF subunit
MAAPPLAGIRVADFTWVWAGPYCTLQLGYLGAEVIRVETRTRLCVTRHMVPMADGKAGPNRSGYFNQYNQGKSSVSINLHSAEGRAVAKRLALASDVVTNNFAAGVMDRLGLGYEELRKSKPDIIMITMSGFGETGPLHEYVAYGPAQVPLSGLSALTGYKGGPPLHVGFSYGDPNGGIHGAFAVLAALYHRARTGEGQNIDLSQWEASVAMVAEGVLEYQMTGEEPERMGNRDHWMAPHGVFRTKDMAEKVGGRDIDMWVSIAVQDDDQWRKLAAAIGRPELGTAPRFATFQARKQNEDELEAIITQWTSQRYAREAEGALQEAGVPAAIASTNKDLFEDPQLGGRNFFVELEHPEVGVRRHTGPPWHMDRTPSEVKKPAPILGQDTDDVMTRVLGYTDEEVAKLREVGALD